MLGQQARQISDPRTIAAGAVLAGTTAIAGAAIPFDEIITVPAAFWMGTRGGSALANAEIEAANAYKEQIDSGVSKENAYLPSLAVGGANAALEFVQLQSIGKALKLVKAANVDEAVKKTAIKIIGEQAMKYGQSVGSETLQEIAQEAVTIAGTSYGKSLSGVQQDSLNEIMSRLAETGISSAISFGILGAPSAAYNTHSQIKANKNASDVAKQNESEYSLNENTYIPEKETGNEIESIIEDVKQEVINNPSYETLDGLDEQIEYINIVLNNTDLALSQDERMQYAKLKEGIAEARNDVAMQLDKMENEGSQEVEQSENNIDISEPSPIVVEDFAEALAQIEGGINQIPNNAKGVPTPNIARNVTENIPQSQPIKQNSQIVVDDIAQAMRYLNIDPSKPITVESMEDAMRVAQFLSNEKNNVQTETAPAIANENIVNSVAENQNTNITQNAQIEPLNEVKSVVDNLTTNDDNIDVGGKISTSQPQNVISNEVVGVDDEKAEIPKPIAIEETAEEIKEEIVEKAKEELVEDIDEYDDSENKITTQNEKELLKNLQSGKLTKENIILKNNVNGFTSEQRSFLVDSIIDGANTDVKTINVKVPNDGSFSISNKPNAIVKVLDGLNVKIQNDMSNINSKLNNLLKKTDRINIYI